MNAEQRKQLLVYARDVIASKWSGDKAELAPDKEFERKTGIFVSLHKQSELRGCIGYISGYASIHESIRQMALAAAFRDPRFAPVKAEELEELEIEISILGELIPIKGPEDIEINRDGLYIEHPDGSGLLLPQVATDWQWSAMEFIQQVCRKAGLSRNSWQDEGTELYRFTAEVFGEGDARR